MRNINFSLSPVFWTNMDTWTRFSDGPTMFPNIVNLFTVIVLLKSRRNAMRYNQSPIVSLQTCFRRFVVVNPRILNARQTSARVRHRAAEELRVWAADCDDSLECWVVVVRNLLVCVISACASVYLAPRCCRVAGVEPPTTRKELIDAKLLRFHAMLASLKGAQHARKAACSFVGASPRTTLSVTSVRRVDILQ